MCGKYKNYEVLIDENKGSPPRVWEVQKNLKKVLTQIRITPTCVGSTIAYDTIESRSGDHPHVCGKYINGVEFADDFWGSPPRVWEVPFNAAFILDRLRITPTCVGSTLKDPSKIAISY